MYKFCMKLFFTCENVEVDQIGDIGSLQEVLYKSKDNIILILIYALLI
jgi:hypothetical protein